MPDNDNTGYQTPDRDMVQLFQLESSSFRGRAVKLEKVLDDILAPHEYPQAVAALVAETVTLTVLMASLIKYDGIFTLQIKGAGPVTMLVADVLTNGDVRACAMYDTDAFKVVPLKEQERPLRSLLGDGHIVFTVDQPATDDRYQGIVALEGESLADCMQNYFRQSEQIPTAIKMAVDADAKTTRSAAILLQSVPQDGGVKDIPGSVMEIFDHEEEWRRAEILLGTCKPVEMLDPAVHSNALLFRLFHEEGVRVFAPRRVQKSCRCSAGRVESVLASMPEEDIDFIAQDGIITVKCEFCSHSYHFDKASIHKKDNS